MDGLTALAGADFDWALHLRGVWRDLPHDVPALHAEARTEILGDLERTAASADPCSPLGRVVVGQAGAGKTHLLAALRAAVTAKGWTFVLVDMSDVHDFWATTVLGWINSLQRAVPGTPFESKEMDPSGAPEIAGPGADDDSAPQYRRMLARVIDEVRHQSRDGAAIAARQARAPVDLLQTFAKRLLAGLARLHPDETYVHQDTLRALILLNSEDFELRDAAYAWLQGLPTDEGLRKRFGMRLDRGRPAEVVRGLSWLASFRGPTLLAIDQLDAIVGHRHLAAAEEEAAKLSAERRTSQAIIHGIAGGLMALRDLTCRTLTLVSCLEATWSVLRERGLRSSADRFRPPRPLNRIRRREVARDLVAARLAPAFARSGFEPPYATWPFAEAAFESAREFFPRMLLQRCEAHRRACLDTTAVAELASFETDAPPRVAPAAETDAALARLDQRFATLRASVAVASRLTEEAEDGEMAQLVRGLCRLWLRAQALPLSIDVNLETDFGDERGTPPLHARLRVERRGAEGAHWERHLCLRALLRTNALAFQSRLKAAMTASGIDANLAFRRLVILRGASLPGGEKTEALVREFAEAGGRVVAPAEADWTTLAALLELERDPATGPVDFETWLRNRRMLESLPLLADCGLCAEELLPPDARPGSRPDPRAAAAASQAAPEALHGV